MSRMIDADIDVVPKADYDVLLKRFKHLIQSDYIKSFDAWDSRKNDYVLDIRDAGSVRHGHWIRSSDGYWDECSKCHAYIDISMGSYLYDANGYKVEYDWCPHCGCVMDEVGDV